MRFTVSIQARRILTFHPGILIVRFRTIDPSIKAFSAPVIPWRTWWRKRERVRRGERRERERERDWRVKRGIFYSGMPAARWPHLAHLFGAGFARGLERPRSLPLSFFFSAALAPSEQDSGLMASRPYFVVCRPLLAPAAPWLNICLAGATG